MKLSSLSPLELISSPKRVVTSSSDKLCAEERFFGSNAMSKQDTCTCGSTNIESISRIINDKRQWGVWCNSCQQWGRPVNSKRSFTNDTYASEVFSGFRQSHHSSQWNIRGVIDEDDLRGELRKLPSHKSPGDDLLPNELLRDCPEDIFKVIHSSVNDILTGGEMPSEWKRGIVKLLEKKQPASLLGNQRPVCCARTIYKVVSHIINNRLVKILAKNDIIEEDQEGGLRKRSCRRQVQKIVHIFEDAKRSKKQLYCVYIDWRNAYNGIDQDVIWEA